MREIQKFALENIYCAPHQDRQYTFTLVRVSKPNKPNRRSVRVYSAITKHLPDNDNYFNTYLIGNVHPSLLNLMKQNRNWYTDKWVNVAEDMNLRDYIFQVYDQNGVMCPRANVYYTFIDESSLMFAIKVDDSLKRNFDVESFKFLRLYSNQYFKSSEYLSTINQKGIEISKYIASSVADIVTAQSRVATLKSTGGEVIVYVNGYYTDSLTLHLPTPATIELLYDQSIISKEKHTLSELRTFTSTKDNKLKYLIYRDAILDRIQYEDDNELYITDTSSLSPKGLMFYQHKEFVVRNVTDKDYSVYSYYVNNQASYLSSLVGGVSGDKQIVLYTRKSGLDRELKYNSLKLHELYKLPREVQLDVLTNTNYTITDFRAETLENSDYFKLASLKKMNLITPELARSTVGYNGITHEYAKNTHLLTLGETYIDVPLLYRDEGIVYEYGVDRKMSGRFPTDGPIYIPKNSQTRYVEFIVGKPTLDQGTLYSKGEVISLEDAEFRIVIAAFEGLTKVTEWVDVSEDPSRVNVTGNVAIVTLGDVEKAKVIYQNKPLLLDFEVPMIQGTLFFPIRYLEDRGDGLYEHDLDYYPETLEVYMNGSRLVEGTDFILELPHINIINKTYIQYNNPEQSVHIRARGVSNNSLEVNQHDITGFVNNGVLGRNGVYDVRDDRTFSIFAGGNIYVKENVKFAEEDNVVRLTDPLNGSPYVVSESMVPLHGITGLCTVNFFKESNELNTRISDLFSIIYPEPDMNEFNVIPKKHYVFSPVVSKMVNAILTGVIPAAVYTAPYDDGVIFNLLNSPEYKLLHKLDPTKLTLPPGLVEIHPHLGNTVVSLNLHQYRFITNVVRILTNGNSELINLSGYLSVTT